MRLALTATEKGRRAASEYNIPKSTLGDRVSGKILPGAKAGRKPYLTPNEEDELVKFLLNYAAIGYGRSRKEVIALVEGILETRGLDGSLTCGWWDGFKARHPPLSLRQVSLLSYSRAVASDRDVIDRYFDLLEETLEKIILMINLPKSLIAMKLGWHSIQKSAKLFHKEGIRIQLLLEVIPRHRLWF